MSDSPLLLILLALVFVTWACVPLTLTLTRRLDFTGVALVCNVMSMGAVGAYHLGLPPDPDKLKTLCQIPSETTLFCNPDVLWLFKGVMIFDALVGVSLVAGLVFTRCRRVYLNRRGRVSSKQHG